MHSSRKVRRARGIALLAAIAIAAIAVVRALGGDGSEPPPDPAQQAAALVGGLGPRELVGQRIVYPVGRSGLAPEVERRLRSGRAAGVILFDRNTGSPARLRELTRRVARLAGQGPVPPVPLIMADQEGGPVRRLAGPPRASALQMGRLLDPAAISEQGAATGRLLAALGINVDLAPVADLGVPGGALRAERRTFGSDPGPVSTAATAFADGLRASGVAATAKHFPGLGSAGANTDQAAVTVVRSVRERLAELEPFRSLIDDGVELVMLSSAVYPRIDPTRPAGLSPIVSRAFLREQVGFEGVSVTDALDTPALAAHASPARVAVEAAAAGTDLLLYAHTVEAALAAERALLEALRARELSRSGMRDSARRVLALRYSLGR